MIKGTVFKKFDKVKDYERPEDFLDNAAVAIHFVDRNGLILYGELALLGFPEDEYIGHNIAEFHAEQTVIENIFSRLSKNEDLHNHEARLNAKMAQ